ncbi:MAG: DNA mismatch repair endonuclease MutL [Anaerolineae bacterium]|nr:DNA mismatch repair endonuclease MutL [Anaerolineae bacterium]
MTIHILPEIVAAQIAAGEVVERPASVVKELVENAIDASADHIHIDVEEGGQRLIRVSDNGHGIPSADVATAFLRHATSKIQTLSDLDHLNTLGFRGEALHSIASVSRLTLITRHRDEQAGTRIVIAGGKTQDQRPVGAPAGTVVTVEDLFFNTPARLKFLKSATTERRQITTLVTNFALAYPAIRFSLSHDSREVFRTYGGGKLADVLPVVLGAEAFRHMLEVMPLPASRPDLPEIRVSGFVSAPDYHHANRTQITLFVNGRLIRDTALAYAVTQAYHTLLPQGRYPIAVLMITLPPEEVDVNVHPTKAEVRFRSPDAVFAAVQRAVRSAVISQAPPPEVRPHPDVQWRNMAWSTRRDMAPARADSNESSRQSSLGLEIDSPGYHGQHVASAQPGAPGSAADDDEAFLAGIPEGMGRPSQPRTLPMLRVLGQVGAAYIVAEGPAGLYLIDQHAAHERILYEQFLAEAVARQSVAQQTLDSVTVELPLRDMALVQEHLEQLAGLGFELEPFGATTLRVRAIPAMLARTDPTEAVRLVLADLEVGAPPGQRKLEEIIALRVCKAAAVKAGQVLSLTEMQAIIRQLERSQSPHTCPHGRPTLLHISAEQLARQFGRT